MTQTNQPRHTVNRQVWPLRAILASAEDHLAAARREPNATLVVEADAALTDVEAALAKLVAAGARVTVRIQRADEETLQRVAGAGAEAIEWTVRAPTTGAAVATGGETDEADALQHMIAGAGEHGLAVRLRWRVTARTVVGLTELDQLADLGTTVTVVALPALDRADAPALADVTRAWPAELPDDVVLLTSDLWPACMGGQTLEPATTAERHQAAARHIEACTDCPLRAQAGHAHGCPGVPAALADREGGTGDGWLAWRKPHVHAPRPNRSSVNENCVEARGLALGLRRAWRLMVPADALQDYEAAFGSRGWHVLPVANVDAGAGGRIQEHAASTHVLTVIASRREDGEAARAAELGNLHRPPTTGRLPGEHLAAITATHRTLGSLYGYPSCCVEAFIDAHTELVEQVRDTDNALAILRATLRTRHFDYRLASLPGQLGEEVTSPLRHLPCRFDCPASIELADALLADLSVHNPVWTATLHAHPPQPVVLLADGTYLKIAGQVVAPDELRDVTSVSVGLSQVADAATTAALQDLAASAWQGLRVVPGEGLLLLRDGEWQLRSIGPSHAPRASEFPILLPFATLES